MSTAHRVAAMIAAGLLSLTTVAACDPVDGLTTQPAAGPSLPGGSPGDGVVTAELDALTVGTWAPMTGYSRDRFEHWVSQGHSCDTREVVLQREGTAVIVGDDCKITAGTWVSVYDGETFTNPTDLDIDHIVPLANAWRTGAATWTDELRSEFANDLTRPQLLAVSASSNRSKGDQDPSQWRPPRQDHWCAYAQSWITVKAYWHLSVTTDEKAALAEMLGTC